MGAEAVIGKMKRSEINGKVKSELVELLVIAKFKGIYEENEDRPIHKMKLSELKEEVKRLTD
ncbi:MAG: hypothetical protein MJ048_04790 [Acidaminococcaceae bacterium]|nr:hypothetical protein [Acidaminococcaceae bacterium]